MTDLFPRRLTLVIGSLGGGGAERVLSVLAGAWADLGHEVTILTFEGSKPDHFRLHQRVNRQFVYIGWPSHHAAARPFNELRRLWQIRRAILETSPDVVISFTDLVNVRVLCALVGTRLPVIISERVDPRRYALPPAWEQLRRLVYRRAALLVVQTEGAADWARTVIRPARIRIIPNPVRSGMPTSTGLGRQILAMGRLQPQKGFDLLIAAWAQLSLPGWELMIAGEGPERTSLEALAARLGVTVALPGLVSDSDALMASAGIFVLSSRFEGFPNVLMEAMAAGLPVISFDCDSGPRDLIDHNRNGLLVPEGDVDALADAIRTLASDPERRARLGSAAQEVRNRFALDLVLGDWNTAIASLRSS